MNWIIHFLAILCAIFSIENLFFLSSKFLKKKKIIANYVLHKLKRERSLRYITLRVSKRSFSVGYITLFTDWNSYY